MTEASVLPCIDAGVDYLTCTFSSDAFDASLPALIHAARREEIKQGGIPRSWGLSGYAGEQCGGLEWGARHDGGIVRLSGPTAQFWWPRFAVKASNISRIDIQRTFDAESEWSKVIARHWRQMRDWWADGKKRPKPKAFVGPSGIESVYSGQRVSETFLRIYHRGSKPGLEGALGHVRYELELKGKKSRVITRRALEHKSPGDYLRSILLQTLTTRGCRLQWSDFVRACPHVPASKPDAHKCLAWLSKSVAPSVQRLIELGYVEEVMESLGLLDHFTDVQQRSKEERCLTQSGDVS